MPLSDAGLFLGRFHPLLVHLPIGFLLLAIAFEITSRIKKYHFLHEAVPFSLLIGTITAVCSCITGYVLSLKGDYDPALLDKHKWAGIITALVSLLAYFISIQKLPVAFFRSRSSLIVSLVLLMVSISVAGHLGGSLTHGEGYLSTAVLFEPAAEKIKVTNLKDALVFRDVVQPILADKCGGCHNNSKRKGKLSLESFASILKGGKHGKVLAAGDAAGSEIFQRVSLNPADKKFMPADGKPPLTTQEIALIKWWIEKAAAEKDVNLVQAKPPADIQNAAAAYLALGLPSDTGNAANREAVQAALLRLKLPTVSQAMLDKLKAAGFVTRLLHVNPDLLDVTLPSNHNKTTGSKAAPLEALLPVKNNIIWLNVSANNLADDQVKLIADCTNLQVLKLDKNPVTDAGVSSLQALSRLQSLNLYNTAITKHSLPIFDKMGSLKTVYVWGTQIKKEDIPPANGAALHIIGGL